MKGPHLTWSLQMFHLRMFAFVDKAYDNKLIVFILLSKLSIWYPYHGMVAAITSTGTADKSAGSILPDLRRSGTQF